VTPYDRRPRFLRRWLALLPPMRLGPVSRFLSQPNIAACARCLTTWAWVCGHATPYQTGSAVFPLCQVCWRDLTPAERMPYYRDLVTLWTSQLIEYRRFDLAVEYEAKWPAIRAAVEAGG
jgi:hypothetical protein